MKSQLICIGDELLLGDTVNTHASWLGQFLAQAGAPLARVHTIADRQEVIKQTIRQAMEEADLVITTGGLGPTHDDITKEAVASLFGASMVLHQPTLDFIKEQFIKKNIPFSSSNYYQAKVPENCEVLFNTNGTAPGMWFHENNCFLAVLPGIGHEMKALMRQKVLPKLSENGGIPSKMYSRYIQTAGIGESTLSDEVIGPLDSFLSENLHVAYLPSPKGTTIRISSLAESEKQAKEQSRALVTFIKKQGSNVIIGEGKHYRLGKAVGDLLVERKATLAVAESCTGGALASTITDIPGSSAYFLGGITAYSNQMKQQQLGVEAQTLKKVGAVSKAVALKMAQQVAVHTGADIGLSTTGIAGPGGGSPQKPVGTVWIGFWSKDRHFCLKAFFAHNRLRHKERTTAVALEVVRRTLLNIETMPYGLKPHTN